MHIFLYKRALWVDFFSPTLQFKLTKSPTDSTMAMEPLVKYLQPSPNISLCFFTFLGGIHLEVRCGFLLGRKQKYPHKITVANTSTYHCPQPHQKNNSNICPPPPKKKCANISPFKTPTIHPKNHDGFSIPKKKWGYRATPGPCVSQGTEGELF